MVDKSINIKTNRTINSEVKISYGGKQLEDNEFVAVNNKFTNNIIHC